VGLGGPDRDHLAPLAARRPAIMAPSLAVIGTGSTGVRLAVPAHPRRMYPSTTPAPAAVSWSPFSKQDWHSASQTLGTLYTALKSHGTAQPRRPPPGSRS